MTNFCVAIGAFGRPCL